MIEKSLKYANWLTEFGFSLIPLNSNPADPHYRKRPRDKDWRLKQYTRDNLQAAYRATHAIGARVPAGYVVIDVDVKDGKQGMLSLAKFPQPNLFKGSYVTTGTKGFHIFFKLPEGVEKIDTGVRSLPDIDFRVVGSQVVAAGSVNADGNPYTWDEATLDLEIVDIPEMPEDIWAFLKPLQREINTSAEQSHSESFYTNDELERLLSSINVEDYRDHDEWLKVLMAAHEASGGLGMDTFFDWCHKDSDPKRRVSRAELTKRWKSMDVKAASQGGITRKFLESIAAPEARALNDFAPERMAANGIPPIKFANVTPSQVKNPEGAAKLNLGPELIRNPVANVVDSEVLGPESETDEYIIDTEDLVSGPLEDLNKTFAVVRLGGKVLIAADSSNIFGQRVIDLMKVQDFALLTRNMPKMEEQRGNMVIQVNVASKWIEWSGRRQYDRVDFFPGCNQSWVDKNYPGVMNLWSGWSIEPEYIEADDPSVVGDQALPPDECSHFTKLICHLSGKPNALEEDFLPDETRYMLDWLAYSMAYALDPIGVAIAIRGRKGIGKGVLSQFLTWMTGSNCFITSDMNHVVGQFNDNLRSSVFVVLDEALWSGSKQAARRLQSLLTEPIITTEGKGMPAVSSRNCIHALLFSNDEWIVPASGEDERRYAVYDAHDGLKHDKAFWSSIKSLYSLNVSHLGFGNLEAKKARLSKLFGWLIARGFWLADNGWVANQNIPVTEALEEQKDFGKDAFALWWDECVLELGELGDLDIAATANRVMEGKIPKDGCVQIWSQKVHDQFEGSEFGQANAKLKVYSARGTQSQLGRFLAKKIPGLKKTKAVVPKELRLEIEHSSLKSQAWQYSVPVSFLIRLSRKLD